MYLAKQRMRCVTLTWHKSAKCFERDLFPEVLSDILDRRTNHLGNIRLGVRHGKTAQHGLMQTEMRCSLHICLSP